MEDFKEGQKVMYQQDAFRPNLYKVSTVLAVTARKVFLQDGSQWTRRGEPWGMSGGWNTRYLREFDEALFQNSRRKRLALKLENMDWDKLTLFQLMEVLGLLKQMGVQKEEEKK